MRLISLGLILAACSSAEAPATHVLTDASDESQDVEAGVPDAPSTCPVCTPAAYSCSTTLPNTESATMTISDRSATSCLGTLPGTVYTLECSPESLCTGDQCVPYTFDGGVLSFNHFGNMATCGALK